ncbi:hypothetical protein GOP47_0030696, partial [Adiantum capillus-veneris]
ASYDIEAYCSSPSPADACAADCDDEEDHVARDIAVSMRSTTIINTVTASILKDVSVMKTKLLLQSAKGLQVKRQSVVKVYPVT